MRASAKARWCLALALFSLTAGSAATSDASDRIELPTPITQGLKSVEQALGERRSQRRFASTPLSLTELGQALWAAQGITHPNGYRTAPSAGALYPLELFIVAGDVTGLAAGIYQYEPLDHALVRRASGDYRQRVAAAAFDQRWIAGAPALFVITAVPARTAAKYRERTERYIAIETGHAAQNIYLQATARGLGTTLVGAFDDDELAAVLDLPARYKVLAVMPTGYPGND